MAKSLWTLPFGKFAGKDIEDVETDYLEWLIGEDWFTERFEHGTEQIKKELEFRKNFKREVKFSDAEWNRR